MQPLGKNIYFHIKSTKQIDTFLLFSVFSIFFLLFCQQAVLVVLVEAPCFQLFLLSVSFPVYSPHVTNYKLPQVHQTQHTHCEMMCFPKHSGRLIACRLASFRPFSKIQSVASSPLLPSLPVFLISLTSQNNLQPLDGQVDKVEVNDKVEKSEL